MVQVHEVLGNGKLVAVPVVDWHDFFTRSIFFVTHFSENTLAVYASVILAPATLLILRFGSVSPPERLLTVACFALYCNKLTFKDRARS